MASRKAESTRQIDGTLDEAVKDLDRIDLAAEPALRSGPILIEPARRRIVHDDGREAVMDPRAMKVVVALLRSPGEVLSRDDLFESCWEGRAVSDDAVDRAVSRARRALREVASELIEIETVTKVGFRARVAPPAGAGTAGHGSPGGRRRQRWALAISVVLIALLAGGWWLARSTAAPRFNAVGIAPFTGADSADDALALGLSDQIRARLAGRSDLQIVSVDPGGDRSSDDRAVARLSGKLGLVYVVRGGIERRGEVLRMNLRLLDTRDGRPVWSDDAVGPVGEIGALQDRVSAGLASALGLRLLPARAPPGGAVSGEAERLYLTARGLLRSRRPERVQTAADLLREAVALEPGFAAAWARLAAAVELAAKPEEPGLRRARREEALLYARRAIALDPDLAEAHGAMGMILGFNSEAAAAHIRRAAALDPNDPEIQLWRGHIYGRDFDYAAQIAAYRRAIQLDPLWLSAAWEFVETATELGLNDEAEAEARRFIRAADAGNGEAMIAALARARGNLAEAVGHFETLRRRPAPGRVSANFYLAETLRQAGLASSARRYYPYPDLSWTIWYGPLPSVSSIRATLTATADNSKEAELMALAVKRLAGANQAGGLADLYFSERGLLTLSAGRRPSPDALVRLGPTVVLVLRQAGRPDEANRLLAGAAAALRRALQAGPAPSYLHAEAAAVFALRGERSAALASLERAVQTGWINREGEALADIADEPAFATLRLEPRFIQVRRRLAAHIARERKIILSRLPA